MARWCGTWVRNLVVGWKLLLKLRWMYLGFCFEQLLGGRHLDCLGVVEVEE